MCCLQFFLLEGTSVGHAFYNVFMSPRNIAEFNGSLQRNRQSMIIYLFRSITNN